MLVGNFHDDGIAHSLAAHHQRAPGLYKDIVFAAVIDDHVLMQVRMRFDLIYHRHHARFLIQHIHMLRIKVADAYGTDALFLVQPDESLPAWQIHILARPMDQVKIHILQAQLFHAFFKAVQRRVIAMIAVSQLGGHKQLFPF